MLRTRIANLLQRLSTRLRGPVPQPAPAWPAIVAAEASSGPLRARDLCPVLVLGHNRSGTTFTQILLQRMGIPVTDEFNVGGSRRPTLDATFDLVAKRIQSRSWLRVGSIRERIEAVFVSLSEAMSDPRTYAASGSGARFANKTPDMEHHLDFYEAVFGRQALYIYCLRHGRDVIVSSLNTKKGVVGRDEHAHGSEFDDADVAQAMQAWKSSVRQIEKFMATAPDRVMLMQVDRCQTLEDRQACVEQTYRFLGLEPDPQLVTDVATTWDKKNHRPNLVYRELSPAQQSLLAADAEFCAMLERHGYSLTG